MLELNITSNVFGDEEQPVKKQIECAKAKYCTLQNTVILVTCMSFAVPFCIQFSCKSKHVETRQGTFAHPF